MRTEESAFTCDGEKLPQRRVRARLCTGLLCLVFLRALPLAAQEVHWVTDLSFYGDNTEFFTPYRVGETILGASARSYLAVRTGPQTEVRLGAFGDHRSGGDRFLDPAEPLLSFHYHNATTQWWLGTLYPVERRGYLEPLEVTTLELTRPVEHGLEWIETRPGFTADLYLNWQHLNTASSREIFDYGFVVRGDLADFASLEAQHHGLHHGGQLHDVGPVTNNVVVAGGLRLHHCLPIVGESSLAAFQLHSSGKVDPFTDGPTINGGGTYLRASIAPAGVVEVFAIWWKGRNFVSTEGDHNYGSPGTDPGFYRPDRRYQELGVARKAPLGSGITLDLEARLHRIDGRVEYSYRFLTQVPLDFRIH